jgi:transposase InsO family protein
LANQKEEIIANAVQEWLAKVVVKTLYITTGSPWGNGYCERFNGSLGHRPPAPETATPPWSPSGSAKLRLRTAMAPGAVLH